MSFNNFVFKVMIVGDSGVGKTTLVQRYVDGKFNTDNKATIGVDFSLKNINLHLKEFDTPIALQIWDIAGEEKFRSTLPYYIPGTNGLMLTFLEKENDTLNNLKEWLRIIHYHLPKQVPIILLSMKNDLEHLNEGENKVKEFLESNEIVHFYRTSSKNGQNVNEAFDKIAELIAIDLDLN